jgi:hypothetical protein
VVGVLATIVFVRAASSKEDVVEDVEEEATE